MLWTHLCYGDINSKSYGEALRNRKFYINLSCNDYDWITYAPLFFFSKKRLARDSFSKPYLKPLSQIRAQMVLIFMMFKLFLFSLSVRIPCITLGISCSSFLVSLYLLRPPLWSPPLLSLLPFHLPAPSCSTERTNLHTFVKLCILSSS